MLCNIDGPSDIITKSPNGIDVQLLHQKLAVHQLYWVQTKRWITLLKKLKKYPLDYRGLL